VQVSSGEVLSEVLEENVVLRSVLREQRKLQAALCRSNGCLRSLLATVPGVLYSFRPNGSFGYLSASVESLLGRPETWYMQDASRYLDQVHPDDLARVYHWRLALLNAEGPGESELRYRLVRPGGGAIEVFDRASVVFEHGVLARVDGLIVAVRPAPTALDAPRPTHAAAC
jgi:PAS domain-containing protein